MEGESRRGSVEPPTFTRTKNERQASSSQMTACVSLVRMHSLIHISPTSFAPAAPTAEIAPPRALCAWIAAPRTVCYVLTAA